MKKLENKIFWTILIILTLFLLSILFIFNYQDYVRERMNVESYFMRMNVVNDDPEKKQIGTQDEDRLFENYVIIIDINDINDKLLSSLKNSILLFGILELIIFVISYNLAKWIIRPVAESFNKQKQFIADASHELKTPLSVIMASAEALENDKNEKKWLRNIQSESERMNKLILDLLELAKLESEDLRKEDETINFSNKHSWKDGEIVVSLEEGKDEIILEVKNKGDAIPKGEEEKIFERFYRVDKSRNRNQNRYGLGLAIAKNIVLNHGGLISARSIHGYTIFTVVFRKNRKR